MLHCNRYFIVLATLSTWRFTQSLGDQTNQATQVQGALSSAMVDPSSLYNFQVPVVPPTSLVSESSVPTITGTTTTEPTSTFTSTIPSATHTASPPPTSDANVLKIVFSIIAVPIFLSIYASG